MSQVYSKLTGVTASCVEYVHPWTESCVDATAGLLVCSAIDSFRIYAVVYLISLLMKGKIPTKKSLLHTLQGIIQSTAFLTTNAFPYSIFLCLLRRHMGTFNFWTASFVPSFLASLCAIFVERKSRRVLLTLYVSNVATETLWRMAESRGIVSPIKYGNIIIFGVSVTVLTLYYRSYLHLINNDSMFNVLKFVIGPNEQYRRPESVGSSSSVLPQDSQQLDNVPAPEKPKNFILRFIQRLNLVQRHKSCPHTHDCVTYTLAGGTSMFTVGIGLQIALKLILNVERIVKSPSVLKKLLWNKDVIKLGLFLGEFSTLFRLCSCLMRHLSGKDHPLHAIPASFLASLSFSNYPDNSIALYLIWKMMHITYNIGVEKKIVPSVPGFTILLYCVSTATLFHAATMEPKNLRPSYWKFLVNLSGNRILYMDRKPFDVYGLETSKAVAQMVKRTRSS